MASSLARVILHLSSRLSPRFLSSQTKYIFCYQQLKFFSIISKNDICGPVQPLPLSMTNTRYYAKGKDKKKADKGKKKVSIDESVLSDIIDSEKLHSQLQSCVDHLKEDYIKNLSLRSTSGSIETLPVKYDGSDYKLQELAQVIRQNPKSVILNLSSFPQAIPAVLEAIQKSGMNLNPQQDGTKLFIPIPKVTKELRESLAKNAKALFIKCKTNVKDVQTKFIKSVKTKEKSEGLSADLSRNIVEQVTAICDSYVAQAEKIFLSKEAELLKT